MLQTPHISQDNSDRNPNEMLLNIGRTLLTGVINIAIYAAFCVLTYFIVVVFYGTGSAISQSVSIYIIPWFIHFVLLSAANAYAGERHYGILLSMALVTLMYVLIAFGKMPLI